MKRVLVKLGVFLVLGAIVNATVAWIVAFGFDRQWWEGPGIAHITEAETDRITWEVGLPMRSVQGKFWGDSSSKSPDGFIVFRRSLLDAIDEDGTMLPYRPIWPGFLVNTVAYAGVLWILWLWTIAYRRGLRTHHKQCGACSYPVGRSDVCTECGASISPRND